MEKQKNSFSVVKVSGFQKKNPTKTWEGLSVNCTVDGVAFKGIIFPERQQSGEAITFA